MTWPTATVLLGAAVLLVVFELETGFFTFYPTIERRVALLAELDSLRKSGVETDPRLAPIYLQLVADMVARPIAGALPWPALALSGTALAKALAGSLFGLVLLATILFEHSTEPNWRPTAVGFALIAISGAFLAQLFPDIGDGWVSPVLIALAEVASMVLIGRTAQETPAPSSAPSGS
jgi:hypothetical protein